MAVYSEWTNPGMVTLLLPEIEVSQASFLIEVFLFFYSLFAGLKLIYLISVF